MKVLDKSQIRARGMEAQIKKEVSVLKMIQHVSVVKLIEVLASEKKIFLVLELVNGGEMYQKIALDGRFEEDEARAYFTQVVEGVRYCHEMGVWHRDLKPENILIDSATRTVKISDFGLASLAAKGTLLHTTCGTPHYVAPEVLLDNGYEGQLADIWSLGVILYVMIAGFLPFDEPSHPELFRKIVNADVAYPKWFSVEALSLISMILSPVPEERPSLDQILEHPWCKGEKLPEEEVASITAARKRSRKTKTKPKSSTKRRKDREARHERIRLKREAALQAAKDARASGRTSGDVITVVGISGDEAMSDGSSGGNLSDSASSASVSASRAEDDDASDTTAAAAPGAVKVNAFDLINKVGFAAMSRMLHHPRVASPARTPSAEQGGKRASSGSLSTGPAAVTFTQFTTPLELSQLMALLRSTIKRMDGADLTPFDQTCQTQVAFEDFDGDGRTLRFAIQLYTMMPNLRLVEFRKIEGNRVAFHEAIDVLRRRVEERSAAPS